MGLMSRIKHGWNAFVNNRDPTAYEPYEPYASSSYYYRPDRVRLTRGNERSIVTSLYNRIALDVSSLTFRHVRLDKNDRFKEYMDTGLDYCLSTEANIDQTSRAFIQDIVLSTLDEGVIAVCPIDTTRDLTITGSYDIETMRTGKIVEWKPRFVKVRAYNDRTGNKQDVWFPKESVAIIENPFYAVMNEPNSTLKRLIEKLNILDAIDKQSGSGKLDMIVQLPYTIRSQARRDQAETRRKDIESQLTGSKYGIAYMDATEKITQLNRPVENNLLKQIEYLTSMLYSQLGFHQTILDGTADEKTMLNYTNTIIKPFANAIVDSMERSFLTKTARSQKQTIMYFTEPFSLVPVNDLAEIADKFTRNEIMTSNEIRQVIGLKPSDDPKADQLVNSNISQPDGKTGDQQPKVPPVKKSSKGEEEKLKEENQNGEV